MFSCPFSHTGQSAKSPHGHGPLKEIKIYRYITLHSSDLNKAPPLGEQFHIMMFGQMLNHSTAHCKHQMKIWKLSYRALKMG